MSVTIKQVAKEAGVSIATVSRVLNEVGPVSLSARQRVLDAVARLRYVPHGGARSLITRRTNTIGVLLPDIHGEFFSELIRGVDRTSRDSGYHVLVSGFHSDRTEIEAVLRATRGRVDGLIVMTPDVDNRTLRSNLPEGVPSVLLNCRAESGVSDSLDVDNFGGAVSMVRHLAGLGHRRIALVTGPGTNHDANERRRGYRQAMQDLDLPWSEELEIPGDFTEQGGTRAGLAVLAMRERPTAVFAANDDMAIGVLAAMREAGVEVPGALALAGFDDIPAARFVSPALTSVHVDIADLGARAMRRVLLAIDAKNTHRRRHETLPSTLVVRESCGATSPRQTPSGGPVRPPKPVTGKRSRGGRNHARKG